MKLDKQIFILHGKRLQYILNESSPFLPYLKKESLNKILQSSLNVLYILEHKFVDTKTPAIYSTKNLIKKFNKLSTKNFSIEKTSFKLTDNEIIDTINYLPIYCKNIFKVDIDQLIEDKKNINLNKQGIEQSNHINQQYGISSNYESNNILFGDLSQINITDATKRMSSDLKNGNIYLYQNKSKLIPLLKLLLIIFLFFSCLASFLCSVFAILCKNLQVSIKAETIPLGSYAILSGCTYIFVGLLSIYQIYSLIKELMSKNKNKVYHTKIFWPLITISLTLLFVTTDIRWTWLIHQHVDKILDDQQSILFFHQMWKYLLLMIICLSGAGLIILIATMIFNPKINSKLLLDQLGKYVNEPIQSPIIKQSNDQKKETKEQKGDNKKKGSSNDKRRKSSGAKK